MRPLAKLLPRPNSKLPFTGLPTLSILMVSNWVLAGLASSMTFPVNEFELTDSFSFS